MPGGSVVIMIAQQMPPCCCGAMSSSSSFVLLHISKWALYRQLGRGRHSGILGPAVTACLRFPASRQLLHAAHVCLQGRQNQPVLSSQLSV